MPIRLEHTAVHVRTLREEARVEKYRRLLVSLGWLAAFVMAVGAGWKAS